MLKLKKAKHASWNGVGFGSSTAEWVVVGHEHIAIRELGISWWAIDTSTDKRIARADKRSDLLEILSSKIS